MGLRDDSTAYAVNWWQVLLVDALLGAAIVGVALTLAEGALRILGTVVGVIYVGLVLQRALRWRRLRRDAGL